MIYDYCMKCDDPMEYKMNHLDLCGVCFSQWMAQSGEGASLCSDERSEEQTTAGRHEVSAEIVQTDGAKRHRLHN